jgi:Zn ribbon nucleic-acid-binding protein/DNA primase
MSNFLRHEHCPSCGSRDNLGVWDDGHKWCFGCGHYVPTPGGTFSRLKFKLQVSEPKIAEYHVKLPSDCTNNIPPVGKQWLDKYQVFHTDIVKYGIKWSERAGGIVLPVYDASDEPVFYQVRRFNAAPKYLTFGRVDNVNTVFGKENQDVTDTKTLVVVEDYISAIRVAYFNHCMPLFGSNISMKKAQDMARIYDNLFIWLDADKYSEAISFYSKYSYLFKNCTTIRTKMDPKDYAHYEINAQLKTYKELMKVA